MNAHCIGENSGQKNEERLSLRPTRQDEQRVCRVSPVVRLEPQIVVQ